MAKPNGRLVALLILVALLSFIFGTSFSAVGGAAGGATRGRFTLAQRLLPESGESGESPTPEDGGGAFTALSPSSWSLQPPPFAPPPPLPPPPPPPPPGSLALPARAAAPLSPPGAPPGTPPSSLFPEPGALVALGRVVVLGGGRALGSALLSALLAARAGNSSVPLPVAVEDGRTGFLAAAPFSAPLHEVDVLAAGALQELWGARRLAPDTLLVDMDPSSPVAPWGAPLACALLQPGFHGGALSRTRVLFLQPAGDAGVLSEDAGLRCYAPALPAPAGAPRAPAAVGALQWWAGAAAPSAHVLLGEGMDPTAPRAPTSPLIQLLRCLIAAGDGLPYEAHDFATERVLAAFFDAAAPATVAAV